MRAEVDVVDLHREGVAVQRGVEVTRNEVPDCRGAERIGALPSSESALRRLAIWKCSKSGLHGLRRGGFRRSPSVDTRGATCTVVAKNS